MDIDHAARAAYKASIPLDGQRWEGLSDEVRERWRAIARAAVQSHPAPIYAIVEFKLPHPLEPYKHVFQCGASKNEIDHELDRLRACIIRLYDVKKIGG